ncbi:MAG: YlbF family regulator [Anaerovoracaceae bacterium]|jgi:cell fate (sporulation/competence/biofilm development) regulator YlbF (YheA/YmcA/DUF963 family)
MNVYDEANKLAQAIRESEEFKRFEAMQKVIDEKPEIKNMIEELQRKQMEQQTKQMMGEDISQDLIRDTQSLYQILTADPEAAQYLQDLMRYSLMMNDVFKILGDAVNIGK